jgi:hypothetical protein
MADHAASGSGSGGARDCRGLPLKAGRAGASGVACGPSGGAGCSCGVAVLVRLISSLRCMNVLAVANAWQSLSR